MTNGLLQILFFCDLRFSRTMLVVLKTVLHASSDTQKLKRTGWFLLRPVQHSSYTRPILKQQSVTATETTETKTEGERERERGRGGGQAAS